MSTTSAPGRSAEVLRAHDCVEARQSGSHIIIRCGECTTVVAFHAGRAIAKGTLRATQK
jgi:predicted RNA binding protein YcfA (HicA-like mRNA interferase family)